ncbi:hypothetical protein D3C74_454580 [compost metagenome]
MFADFLGNFDLGILRIQFLNQVFEFVHASARIGCVANLQQCITVIIFIKRFDMQILSVKTLISSILRKDKRFM